MSQIYCVYCGKKAHRCGCAKEESKLRLFLARANVPYQAQWMDAPYKPVPPQIKVRKRAELRKHYQAFYLALVEKYGKTCAHCGSSDSLVLDHIQSIAKAGESELGNLQLLCAECNRLKGKLCYDCRSNAKPT